ncbi:hypothetical protein HN682_03835, partial [Candidatus Peregrinibacteria bacterium]|nr:hypothetical protein [Candidatus Peregrinibacteria bacterium]
CTKYLEELAGEHFSSIPTEGFKSLGLALSAYASFSEKMDNGFVRPTVLPKESRRMNVKNARNPLVENPVPNDIVYDGEQNLFLITGPNNGGKTTYVKSVGIVQALAQAGLFVPADQAEVSLVDNLYTHFVSPDDITKGEGRYKNELRRMDNIFENATPYSMVLLDEPCGGTSHEEGVEQSKNLLEGFDTLGCATYFTTHMHSLADEVKKDTYESARNFHAQCKKKLIGGGIKYTYKIVPGASGKSYGKEIADEMGLSSKDIKNTIRRNARENEFTNLLRGE